MDMFMDQESSNYFWLKKKFKIASAIERLAKMLTFLFSYFQGYKGYISSTLGARGRSCRGLMTMRYAHGNEQKNPRGNKLFIAIVIYPNHVIIGKSSWMPSHL